MVDTLSRADGSLGAALSNVRTPRANQLSAVHYERAKDALIEHADAINDLEESIENASQIIWEWNETNTAQLQAAHTGIGTPTLSVQSKAWGPALRVAFPTKTAGSLACFVTVNDAGLVLSKDALHRYFYTFRARMVGFSGAAGEWSHAGLAVLCNRLTGASFYGLGVVGSQSGSNRKSVRVQAGTFDLGAGNYSGIGTDFAASVAGVQVQNWLEMDVQALHNGGAPFFRSRYQNECNDISERISTSYDDQYAINQHGAFGAGWNTEVLDSVGLVFVGTGGTTADQYFEFDQIQVVKHPTKR